MKPVLEISDRLLPLPLTEAGVVPVEGSEFATKHHTRSVEARLYRGHRNLEDLTHLSAAQAIDVTKHEHRAVLIGEL